MNFSEKIIELRRKKGLSQEELGSRLGVTRQTISKWELGEITPEMNKIKEISKFFEVDVDYLLNEDKKEVNVKKDNKKNNKPAREKIVLSITLLLLIISIIGIMCISFIKIKEAKENNKGHSIFDGFQIDDSMFEHDYIESQKGSKMGMSIKNTLDDINSYNGKYEENKISIIYNNKTYITKEEIDSLRTEIDEDKNYNLSYEYKDKKIVKAILKREITSREIESFNDDLEFMYSGTKGSYSVRSLFDKIININNKKEHIITLTFDNNATSDKDEIRNLKKQLGDFNEFEVSFEYDEVGFINKVLVERV